MARVKIKFKQPNEGPSKIKLLEILSSKCIYATTIIVIRDGYIVLTRNDEDTENILSKDVANQLRTKGYNHITPPEIKAKRTVIVSRLDSHIYQNDTEAIEREVSDNNDWITDEDIEEIYKFPNSNTIKITFAQTAHAKKAQEKGILLFSMSIPPHQIKEETYTQVITCMK
ncbi:hypothetical protein E2C01_050101 [Portunus trituberculatus]|uniref:Uncharacterized protein n=1 Tax=Portunus trituberculatus TaxID=210409 RepID=A0A5B7GGD1_PORTR|nr:hypothetical protein [Portunus trituberculatus]